MPETPDQWRNAAEAERWATVGEILDLVTSTLEDQRRQKEIGSALDAAPRVSLGPVEFAHMSEMAADAGLTVEEFEGELRERLRKYIRNPNVSVVVSDFKSSPVTILGAVEQPGVRQLQGNKRLFATLLLAGSLKPNAAAVLLTRRRERGEIPWPTARRMLDGTVSVAKFPIAEIKDGRGAAANIMIEPGGTYTYPVEFNIPSDSPLSHDKLKYKFFVRADIDDAKDPEFATNFDIRE